MKKKGWLIWKNNCVDLQPLKFPLFHQRLHFSYIYEQLSSFPRLLIKQFETEVALWAQPVRFSYLYFESYTASDSDDKLTKTVHKLKMMSKYQGKQDYDVNCPLLWCINHKQQTNDSVQQTFKFVILIRKGRINCMVRHSTLSPKSTDTHRIDQDNRGIDGQAQARPTYTLVVVLFQLRAVLCWCITWVNIFSWGGGVNK